MAAQDQDFFKRKFRESFDEHLSTLAPEFREEAGERLSKEIEALVNILPRLQNARNEEEMAALEKELKAVLDPDGPAIDIYRKAVQEFAKSLKAQSSRRVNLGPSEGVRVNRWKAQETMTRAAVAVSPTPQAHADYAEAAYFVEDVKGAFEHSGRALKGGRVDAPTLIIYGRAAYGLGDTRLAAAAARLAMRMDPENKEARQLYMISARRVPSITLPAALPDLGSAERDRALSPVDKAAPPSAGSPQPPPEEEVFSTASRSSHNLIQRAISLLEMRDSQAAHEAATRAIAWDEANAQAWNVRAVAAARLGHYEKSVSDSDRALKLSPGDPTALQTRSWSLNRLGRFKEALLDADATLLGNGSDPFALENRGWALAGLGDREGSLKALERLSEVEPGFRPYFEQALKNPSAPELLRFLRGGPRAQQPEKTPYEPRGPWRRFLKLALFSLSGGLIVALGLINIVSADYKRKMRESMRRALGGGHARARGSFESQYELIRPIGSGGMGLVYQARDKVLDRRVAVKVMRGEIRADPAERARFVQEARTVAALHHPNIVDIYSIIEDGAELYLIFEYVKGRTVQELLKERGPFPFDAARKVIKGVCHAVDYAHRHGIIHRDLKPSNVMVSEQGLVKVMDFGVARQAKDLLLRSTSTATIVGTPHYMAPEQEQGQVRKESDVFSLGVCFYEMVCGRLPFSGQGGALSFNKAGGRVIPLSENLKGPPPAGLEPILARALDPRPDKRFSRAMDFFAALELV